MYEKSDARRQTKIKSEGTGGICVCVACRTRMACSVLGASSALDGYVEFRDVRIRMTATRSVDIHHGMGGTFPQTKISVSSTAASPLKDKGLELHTYQAIRFCIPACISSSPPQSDGLSYPSGPSRLLPGHSRHSSPYLDDVGDGYMRIFDSRQAMGKGGGEGGEGEGKRGEGRGRKMAG